MKNQIIFPERVSKIDDVRIFYMKGTPMQGCVIEFENGDVIQHYDTRKYNLEVFKKGETVKYTMKKIKDGDKVKNRFNTFSMVVDDKGTIPLVSYISNTPLTDYLYIDIETVGRSEKLPKSGVLKDAWEYHTRNWTEKGSYEEKSPLYPEFGKIVCISLGYESKGLSLKSYASISEKDLLTDFISDLNKFFKAKKSWVFAGMNIIDFDMQYIRKRLLANGLEVPEFLDFLGVKPWDMDSLVLDLNLLWSGDTFKKTSLSSLCYALGIDSPKGIMDGSEVHREYHKGNLNKVVEYCESDVLACMQIMRKFYNQSWKEEEEGK